MNIHNDRISTLGERFQSHIAAPESQRKAETAPGDKLIRRSFYMKQSLFEAVDRAFVDANHILYPRTISKSDFLDAFVSVALTHQDELRARLAKNADGDEK